jgi:hypothetical protein
VSIDLRTLYYSNFLAYSQNIQLRKQCGQRPKEENILDGPSTKNYDSKEYCSSPHVQKDRQFMEKMSRREPGDEK